MVYFHVLPCCDQPDSQPSNTSVARRGSFQGSRAPDLNANPGVWGGSRLDPAGFRCVQRGEPSGKGADHRCWIRRAPGILFYLPSLVSSRFPGVCDTASKVNNHNIITSGPYRCVFFLCLRLCTHSLYSCRAQHTNACHQSDAWKAQHSHILGSPKSWQPQKSVAGHSLTSPTPLFNAYFHDPFRII